VLVKASGHQNDCLIYVIDCLISVIDCLISGLDRLISNKGRPIGEQAVGAGAGEGLRAPRPPPRQADLPGRPRTPQPLQVL